MRATFHRCKEYCSSWLLRQIDGKHTDTWLGAISFTESSFFLIPPDFFLLPVVLKKPTRWLRSAIVVTATSVLGGLFGYFIGVVFFDLIGRPLVVFYGLEGTLKTVSELFKQNAFWAIFTAAFTPIPYKIFTIAGGLFRIDLVEFVVASVLGRGMRFFAVAYIAKYFGERASALIYKYFNRLTLAFAVVVVIFVLIQVLRSQSL